MADTAQPLLLWVNWIHHRSTGCGGEERWPSMTMELFYLEGYSAAVLCTGILVVWISQLPRGRMGTHRIHRASDTQAFRIPTVNC